MYVAGFHFSLKPMENEYRAHSANDHVRTTVKGLRVCLCFVVFFTLLDVAMYLTSDDESLIDHNWVLPMPRVMLMGTCISFLFLLLFLYWSPGRLREYFKTGHNVTRPFFILYLGITLLSALSFVLGVSSLAAVFQQGANMYSYKKQPQIGPMPLQSIAPYVFGLKREYGDWHVPQDAYLPIAVEWGGTAFFTTYVLLELVLREIFGRLCRYQPLQLYVISLIQTTVLLSLLAWIPTLGLVSDFVHRLLLQLLLIHVPVFRTNGKNEKHNNQSRAQFVRWKIAEEEKGVLVKQLEDADGHLQELRSKLMMSEEQMTMVKSNVTGLEGLSGYKVDVERELLFQKKLGEGAYGVVYKAKYNGEDVAVKQLLSDKIDESMVRRFKEEIILLTQLHHPNVCQILGAAWDAPHLAIVLEYAKEGDLQVYLKKVGERTKWWKRIKFMRNLAQGMRYLHGRPQPIMHRDLKLENCLVTEFMVCKLSDFGESRGLKGNGEDEGNMTMVGTPYFIAPEIVNGDQYNEACDVFSFAIVLCCLGVPDGDARKVFNQALRDGLQPTKVQMARLKGMHISNKHLKGWRADLDSFKWPAAMVELVKRCWEGDSAARPRMDEVCVEIEKWRPELFGEVDEREGRSTAERQRSTLKSSYSSAVE